MILDAVSLSEWQSCRRRGILSHDWVPLRWRPKVLHDACLRRGIIALSKGADAEKTADEAESQFLQSAANPGLDIESGGDPYATAKEWCAMLRTILEAMSRRGLMTLHDPAPERLNSWCEWRLLAQADDSGTLHRWITVDRWDADALSRELHSWRTMGDIAAARVPMNLHVIVIGQERQGKRASPWARGWRHPAIPHLQIRFARKDGSGFNGWLPYRFAEHSDFGQHAWVDRMEQEGVIAGLVHLIPIECPSDSVLDQTRAQIMYEALRIREAMEDRGMVPWHGWPMSRGACDLFVPCPFQAACYSEQPIDPSKLGLYRSRKGETIPSKSPRGMAVLGGANASS